LKLRALTPTLYSELPDSGSPTAVRFCGSDQVKNQ
jgi:hypothetical protein